MQKNQDGGDTFSHHCKYLFKKKVCEGKLYVDLR